MTLKSIMRAARLKAGYDVIGVVAFSVYRVEARTIAGVTHYRFTVSGERVLPVDFSRALALSI